MRQIACSAAWRADDADLTRWLGPRERQILPAAIVDAQMALSPAPADDVLRELSLCLDLVAPTGMTTDDRDDWLTAAGETLFGIPTDLLAVAAFQARQSADHPSKVVPAIMAVAKGPWTSRKSDLARAQKLHDAVTGKRERKPWEPQEFDEAERCTPEQAAAILEEVGIAVPSRGASSTIPTPEDYVALGLDRDEAERIVERQRREAAQGSIGKALAA